MELGGHIIITKYGRPYYGYGETIIVYPNAERVERICENCNEGALAAGLGPLKVRAVNVRILPEGEAH